MVLVPQIAVLPPSLRLLLTRLLGTSSFYLKVQHFVSGDKTFRSLVSKNRTLEGAGKEQTTEELENGARPLTK